MSVCNTCSGRGYLRAAIRVRKLGMVTPTWHGQARVRCAVGAPLQHGSVRFQHGSVAFTLHDGTVSNRASMVLFCSVNRLLVDSACTSFGYTLIEATSTTRLRHFSCCISRYCTCIIYVVKIHPTVTTNCIPLAHWNYPRPFLPVKGQQLQTITGFALLYNPAL